MLASVIIITKDQKSYLGQTLPTLLKQSIKEPYEIIIVDSGSKDGAKEYIKSIKSKIVRLVEINPVNFSYSRAFNIGASYAKGKYLIRLSGDCIPTGSTWLNEMVKPFRDPKVGGVYGRYTITGKKGYGYPNYWPANRFPNKITRYSVTPTFLGVSFGDAFNFAGGCCAIRRKIWKQRPFNEKLLAADDAEYSWFLHLIDCDIIYNPQAKVIHEHKINPIKTFRAYSGINMWQWVFRWEILKYWLQRVFLQDPYKYLHYSTSQNHK